MTGLASSTHEVAQKAVSGGWLAQSFAEQTEADTRAEATALEIYVFPSSKVAEEAFKLIASAPNAHEEWGGGGTFRRKNVIVNTDQNPPYSLTQYAEKLLNKCAGAGASQALLRPHEEAVDGQTPAERKRSEEDGGAPNTGETVPRTSGDTTSTTPEPAQEPPASENVPNPGQSPARREGE
ncbi:MAG TPA: hypothetical protein VMB05_12915 [Solirubrobacteraceae bacterium]|nr:hypothetical protein [Solirubrobacteraceae bacterium]HUB72936.1 hypothetical protein [Solirubrobacteraceae bacterium]